MLNSTKIILTGLFALIILSINVWGSYSMYGNVEKLLTSDFETIQAILDEQDLQSRTPFRNIPLENIDNPEDALKIIRQQILVSISLVVISATSAAYVFIAILFRPVNRAVEHHKQFVTNASHELQTPIAAIKANIEAYLLDKGLDKKTSSLLQANLKDIEKLEQLSQRLLDLEKIDSNSINLKVINIEKIINKAVSDLDILAKQKNVKIVRDVSPAKVNVDSDLMLMAIKAVLENAIKYSKNNDRVHVTGYLENRSYCIKIVDSGKGIKDEDILFIFDRFYRSKNNSKVPGSGLGLAMVRSVLSLHKGQILVDSQLEVGSTFTLKLPKS